MLLFPIDKLLDYNRCYEFLKNVLHPHGFSCRCGGLLSASQRVHKHTRTDLPTYKCEHCGAVFNIFTGTILSKVRYSCIRLVLLLRGIAQGNTTLHLSQELKLNYKNLLEWRHLLQKYGYENRFASVLKDTLVESDEVFINAGEKGLLHPQPQDPPRVRANKKKA